MSINFHERLMCVFFWHKVSSISNKFLLIIKQHEKVAFPRRQGNQACWMRGSVCLCHLARFCICFVFFWKWLICATYYTNQLPKSLDSFCRKRSLHKSCEKEMEDWEKQQRTSTVYNNMEAKTWRSNFRKEWKKAFTWIQFNESKQTIFWTNTSIL